MRGGARPGAGKKKGSKHKATLEAETIRNYIIQEFIKAKEPLIKALIDKAKTGDIPAIKELLDRAIGKSKEQVEHSGEIKITGLEIDF